MDVSSNGQWDSAGGRQQVHWGVVHGATSAISGESRTGQEATSHHAVAAVASAGATGRLEAETALQYCLTVRRGGCLFSPVSTSWWVPAAPKRGIITSGQAVAPH